MISPESAVLAGEFCLIVWVAVLARRGYTHAARGSGDVATRFRSAARLTLKTRIPADILATEVSLLYFAFRRPATRQCLPGTYTVHRRTGYSAVVVGLVMAVAVEMVAIHLLLREWSALAAWLLTGLGIYACIWIVGDYRAMAARPMIVTAGHLLLRVGVRWEATIPRASIACVDLLTPLADSPTSDTLVAAVIGEPNLRVKLHSPVEVLGMYGKRKTVREIRLAVDDAPALCSELRSPTA